MSRISISLSLLFLAAPGLEAAPYTLKDYGVITRDQSGFVADSQEIYLDRSGQVVFGAAYNPGPGPYHFDHNPGIGPNELLIVSPTFVHTVIPQIAQVSTPTGTLTGAVMGLLSNQAGEIVGIAQTRPPFFDHAQAF